MSRQDIAHLTFKVVGLYCIILAIPLFGWVLDLVFRYAFGAMVLPPGSDPGGVLVGSTPSLRRVYSRRPKRRARRQESWQFTP